MEETTCQGQITVMKCERKIEKNSIWFRKYYFKNCTTNILSVDTLKLEVVGVKHKVW